MNAILSKLAFLLLTFFMSLPVWAYDIESSRNYARLMELIEQQDLDGPLFALTDYLNEFDREIHRESVRFFSTNPELMEKIQTNLNSEKVRWKVGELSYRLVYVPEERHEYAALYENYCRDVIDLVLDRTKLPNPYSGLMTLGQNKPELAYGEGGITAYLVHNIAKEYTGTYIFSNPEEKKVRIKLAGTVFSGEVGSYTSNIHFNDDGTVSFVRNKYTIWQNSAKNPYTALMTPVEETLHIALRTATEKAIRHRLQETTTSSIKAVEAIVAEWIAVEEAVVGGLVHALVPDILNGIVNGFPPSLVDADVDAKEKFEQYHLLRRGISLVAEMGCEHAVQMYMDDPMVFKQLLSDNSRT